MNPNKIPLESTVSTLRKKEAPGTGEPSKKSLPVPAKALKKKQSSRFLMTGFISLWALVIFGALAALLTTVGNTKGERKEAAMVRQQAYKALLPVLETVDQVGLPDREAALLGALKTIDEKVLTIDPKHPLAIQTKDEIQIELASINASRIDNQKQTISQQAENLNQSQSQIDELLKQVQMLESNQAKLEAENQTLSSDKENLLAANDQLEKNLRSAQSDNQSLESSLAAVRSEKQKLQSLSAQYLASNQKLESSNNWYVSTNKKLESTNNWYQSTNKKLESTNKWLSSEKAKLAQQVCYLNDKLKRAYADNSKNLHSKNREIASLKRQIAMLKNPKYITFQR